MELKMTEERQKGMENWRKGKGEMDNATAGQTESGDEGERPRKCKWKLKWQKDKEMDHYTDQRKERVYGQHSIVCEVYLNTKSRELHSGDETERNPFYYFHSKYDQNNPEI